MSHVIKSEKPRIRYSADGLVNVYSGMGTNNSKSAHNNWQMSGLLGPHVIDTVYRESWLAQAVCATYPEDECRQWRKFNGEHSEMIEREEKRIDLRGSVCESRTYERAYGGAGILMITDQDLEKALDVRRIKKGGLKRLIVLDRFDLTAPILNMTNPMEANYLLPEYYTLAQGSQRIHWTHIARFGGMRLPRRLAALQSGWGDSELRRILADINAVSASFMGISELMQEANVDTITSDTLADDLSTDQESKIIERYQMFNLMKSNFGLSLLDGTEKLDRLTLNLSGVSQAQEQLLTWMCGAAKIPMTRLFGTSAKGMSATGEGDEGVYYDRVSSNQESKIRPPLTQIDQVMVRSALGAYPDDTDFEFNPLSQLSTEERANVDYTDSQTDTAHLTNRIIKRSHIARRLQASDTYEITDDDIKEIEEQEKAEKESIPDDDFDLDGEGGDGSDEEPEAEPQE